MKVLAIIESIGLGHAVRTFEILREFRKRGYEAKVIANNSAASFFIQKGVPVFDIPLSINLKKKGGKLDVGRAVLENIRLSNLSVLTKTREVLKNERPDVIIIDTSIVGVIAANTAKGKNTPLLFITTDNTYQTGIKDQLDSRQNLGIIDNFVRAATDCYIVPDFPPPYTISEYNLFLQPKMKFVGPLSWASRQKSPKKTRGVLLTQGKSSICSDKVFDILRGKARIPHEDDYIRSFIKSETIVHHGGHTTAMDSILLGKPQVIIPVDGYAERENNGKKIEQLHLGRMVYEKFLDRHSLEYAIGEARERRKHAGKFSKYARSYNAPRTVYEIFESLCRE